MIKSYPKKETRKVSRLRVLKPAHYQEIDTGRLQKVEIVELDGSVSIEERPIIERKYIEPLTQKVEEDRDFWVVKTIVSGAEENHEFASKEDALSFYRG